LHLEIFHLLAGAINIAERPILGRFLIDNHYL